ncbi:MAG: amidohydrolase family protein [Oscillospiraceae bacterium]
MYIDFHTHAFTDKIAERAISKLETTAKTTPETRGTIAQTVKKLDEWGVSSGVILPIATKPSQQASINDWAAAVQKEYLGKIYSFGTVHPDAPDAMDELFRVKELGLCGIKIHPDYQGVMVDDEKMFPIYEKCAELRLPIVFHAGFDPLSPELIHAPPEKSANVAKLFPKLTIILAHLGGMLCWDDVEKFLVGKNVFFDTAMIGDTISDKQAERIIKNHGSEKILLGSDCPWHDTPSEIAMLSRIGLSEEEKENIFHKNAEKLLKINKNNTKKCLQF